MTTTASGRSARARTPSSRPASAASAREPSPTPATASNSSSKAASAATSCEVGGRRRESEWRAVSGGGSGNSEGGGGGAAAQPGLPCGAARSGARAASPWSPQHRAGSCRCPRTSEGRGCRRPQRTRPPGPAPAGPGPPARGPWLPGERRRSGATLCSAGGLCAITRCWGGGGWPFACRPAASDVDCTAAGSSPRSRCFGALPSCTAERAAAAAPCRRSPHRASRNNPCLLSPCPAPPPATRALPDKRGLTT